MYLSKTYLGVLIKILSSGWQIPGTVAANYKSSQLSRSFNSYLFASRYFRSLFFSYPISWELILTIQRKRKQDRVKSAAVSKQVTNLSSFTKNLQNFRKTLTFCSLRACHIFEVGENKGEAKNWPRSLAFFIEAGVLLEAIVRSIFTPQCWLRSSKRDMVESRCLFFLFQIKIFGRIRNPQFGFFE